MFQNNLVRFIILGILGVGLIGGFMFMNMNGETATCNRAGYGEYDDENGVCLVNGEYANNLVIVSGNTANTPAPSIDNKESITYNFLKNSVAKHSNIKIVSASTGNNTDVIDIEQNETNDANGFVESINNSIAEINKKLNKAPSANGVDYLRAISKAGRDVSSNSLTHKNKESTIIIIGSGLSDSGILNFADKDYLHKNVDDIIKTMDRANELTHDLEGIKIIWYGIGQVKSPQEELSDSELETLKNIYSTILKRRGAKEVIFDDTINTHEPVENNPYTVKTTKTGIIIFTESELGFKANSSEIANKQIAKESLANKGVFESARNNPSKTIIVTGYMAAGSCNSNVDTSLAGARAETVKRFLEENGVKNDIEVVNGGVFESEKTECVDGVWQSNLANYRRKVTINFK